MIINCLNILRTFWENIPFLVDQLPENIDNILTRTEISVDQSYKIIIEVIKICNLDEIIFAFANKLQDKGIKSE